MILANDPRSRGRDGRIMTGTAVGRPLTGGGGNDVLFGPWGHWWPWYSSGLNWNYGYTSFNPWVYGTTRWTWGRYGLWYDPYDPYGYGMYDPWFSDPYAYGSTYGSSQYGSSSYSGSSRTETREVTGSVRLRVKPGNAKVYLDGTLVGTVDQFDGLSSHLAAAAGAHQIEFRADGYEPATTTIVVEADKTITARASLKTKK